jgi:hypothetical protein
LNKQRGDSRAAASGTATGAAAGLAAAPRDVVLLELLADLLRIALLGINAAAAARPTADTSAAAAAAAVVLGLSAAATVPSCCSLLPLPSTIPTGIELDSSMPGFAAAAAALRAPLLLPPLLSVQAPMVLQLLRRLLHWLDVT